MKRIILTVTNDLSYDQRMQRICTTLANNGYTVTLAGRKLYNSIDLVRQPFTQKRLSCLFENGFAFYTEYNIHLFFWLLFQKFDIICAVDLDTILPCYMASVLKRKKRIYDAHELFIEQKEIITRRAVHKFWSTIEKFTVPKFLHGYTVSKSIAIELNKRYHVNYSVIRNVPVKYLFGENSIIEEYILYQGSVNEARGLENLVIAMHQIHMPLHIYGDGNIYKLISGMIEEQRLQHKIILKGKLAPGLLTEVTKRAYIGLNLVEPTGLNQLYSLANKFFDYIQAGIPQLTMNFPEYRNINSQFEVALLIDSVEVNEIALKLNLLINDAGLYDKLRNNCLRAREVLHWENEQKNLIHIYKKLSESAE